MLQIHKMIKYTLFTINVPAQVCVNFTSISIFLRLVDSKFNVVALI